MPEPTEEMRQAFLDAGTLRGYGGQLEDLDAGLRAVLEIAERDTAQELIELRSLFALQWERMREATERWRAEDPEGRALIMPDLGALLRWLMDDADRARGVTGSSSREEY
jgi:hypothetical protein